MTKITFKNYQGNFKTIDVDNGLSVMEGAIQNDIPGIDADCGGGCACATCMVFIGRRAPEGYVLICFVSKHLGFSAVLEVLAALKGLGDV